MIMTFINDEQSCIIFRCAEVMNSKWKDFYTFSKVCDIEFIIFVTSSVLSQFYAR